MVTPHHACSSILLAPVRSTLLVLLTLLVAHASPAGAEAPPPMAPLRSAVLPVEGATLRSEVFVALSYAYQDRGPAGRSSLFGSGLKLEIPKGVQLANTQVSLVEHAPTLLVGGRVALWQRVELGLELPVLTTRGIVEHGGPSLLGGGGLGNLRLRAKVRLAGGAKVSWALAGYLAASLPTFSYYGDNDDPIDSWSLRPGVAFDLTLGQRLSFSADLSLLLQILDQPERRVLVKPDPNVPPRTIGGGQARAAAVLGFSIGLRLWRWAELAFGAQLIAGGLRMTDALTFAMYTSTSTGMIGIIPSDDVVLHIFGGLRVRPVGGLFVEAGARFSSEQALHGGGDVALHAAAGYRF
jgi:hypothetical protein